MHLKWQRKKEIARLKELEVELTLSPRVWGSRFSMSSLVYSLKRPINYCCRICTILCTILKKRQYIEALCRPLLRNRRIVNHYSHLKIMHNEKCSHSASAFRLSLLCWLKYELTMAWNFNEIFNETCNFVEIWLQQRCSPVDLAKFLETSILQNICKRLLLNKLCIRCIFSFLWSPFWGERRV